MPAGITPRPASQPQCALSATSTTVRMMRSHCSLTKVKIFFIMIVFYGLAPGRSSPGHDYATKEMRMVPMMLTAPVQCGVIPYSYLHFSTNALLSFVPTSTSCPARSSLIFSLIITLIGGYGKGAILPYCALTIELVAYLSGSLPFLPLILFYAIHVFSPLTMGNYVPS